VSRGDSPDTPATFTSLSPLTVPQAGQLKPEFNLTVDILRTEHLDAARASVKDPFILKELEEEIERDCDWLRNFLFAAHVKTLLPTTLTRASLTLSLRRS
jgi:aspartate kinase